MTRPSRTARRPRSTPRVVRRPGEPGVFASKGGLRQVGIKLGWFAIRSSQSLPEVLRRICASAAQHDIPDAFRIFAPGKGGVRLWRTKRSAWTKVILQGWSFHAADAWAQAVSLHTRSLAVAFIVLEGTWSYHIFDSGEEVA